MRCAPVVAVIGAAWLLLALPIDLLLRLSHPDAWQIYRSGEAWIDWFYSARVRPTARAVAARNRRLSRAGALILGLPTGSARRWYPIGSSTNCSVRASNAGPISRRPYASIRRKRSGLVPGAGALGPILAANPGACRRVPDLSEVPSKTNMTDRPDHGGRR